MDWVSKPVIRMSQMEMAMSTHPTPLGQAIVKLMPLLHPATPVQCHCGQLVPVSGIHYFTLLVHSFFTSFHFCFPYLDISFHVLHFDKLA